MAKIDIRNYQKYFTFDEPIPFNGLLIYPASVLDYFEFFSCVDVLMQRKDRSKDFNVLKMSYLDYILYLGDGDDVFSAMFLTLLHLTTKCTNVYIRRDEKGKTILCIETENEKISEFSPSLFDNFKDIILFQNLPYYDDNYIDPELEKEINMMNKVRNKNRKIATLEEQMVCLQINLKIPIDYIKSMTIRKFILALRKADKELHYKIYKSASMSGLVELKGEIDHWLDGDSYNPLDGVVTDYDELESKIKSANNSN